MRVLEPLKPLSPEALTALAPSAPKPPKPPSVGKVKIAPWSKILYTVQVDGVIKYTGSSYSEATKSLSSLRRQYDAESSVVLFKQQAKPASLV
jgi:hypothetical protein